MYDCGIVNGEIWINDKFEKLNVYLKDGKIATLTTGEEPCSKVIDARTKKVLPGLIDPHVHFALGVGSKISKDDFTEGSREAALGGVTTYIDFLDPVKKAEEIQFKFEKRNQMAEHSLIDYAFHTTIANPTSSPEDIFIESQKVGINSVKLFTTYADTDRRTYDTYIMELLQASKRGNRKVVIHAENDDLIWKRKDISVVHHEDSRCALTENIEVMKLALMARKTGGNLYIVHVSAGSSVHLLADNFQTELENHQITLESCPHYFLLNTEYLARPDGYKYTMTPPIRPEVEREELTKYRSYISTIGTDHCPYTKEQKEHSLTSEIPMGIGGIKYSFLNMYNLYGYEMVDRFTTGPAKAYGLSEKGSIIPGKDADFMLFDENAVTKVQDEMSVYDGKTLKGAIYMTISRGEICMQDGVVQEHQGNYIARC